MLEAMKQKETHERIVPVEGVHNLRHMGGYQTRSGQETNADLLRAASLHRMTDGSSAELARLGVRTVVDFRSEGERKTLVTPELARHGIKQVAAAVFQSDASPVALEGEFPGFAVVYETFLETGRGAYRSLAETIATTEGRLVFHCAAGKDRTGVAAALLLDLAGVDDADILTDYSLSCALLAPMLPEWMAGMAARGLDPSRAERILASEPEDMASLLGHLRERWGSAGGYFRDIGVSDDTLRAVRGRMLGSC